jgi:hypothetical protein
MIRETIFVAGYPKSGNTWLTRLLADVLDSPSGGCRPIDDDAEVATEGQDREGKYIVRKGHFRPVENNEGPIVPKEHKLAWKRITTQKVVLIYRDPRDVLVSGAHYWRRDQAEHWDMIRTGHGSMRLHGPWDWYMDEWLRFEGEPWFVKVSYESLLKNTYYAICYVLSKLRIDIPVYSHVESAIQRQSFEEKKKALVKKPHNPKYNSKFHRHFMRKGQAGSWKDELNPILAMAVVEMFGDTMRRLGYVS